MAAAPQVLDDTGPIPLRLLRQPTAAAAKGARERRLSLVISAVVATLTAAGLGLLIATTAGAARSAAADHARSQAVLAQQEVQASADSDAQLTAYRDRLQQAYDQLQTSYITLQQRDAAYQEALQQTEASAVNLQTADQTTATRLAEAYQQLQQAHTQIQQLQGEVQTLSAQLSRGQGAAQPQIAAAQGARPASPAASAAGSRVAPTTVQKPIQQTAPRRQPAGDFDD